MRTIEFRGKRTDNGEWIYGFLLGNLDPTKEHKEYRCWHIFEGVSIAPARIIEAETAGQFTGRYDHSTAFAPKGTTEVKVYEGDVVAAHFYYMNELIQCNMEVYFNEDELQWKLRTDKLDVPMHECNYMIVKGNIHDNPELVNQ